MNTTDGTEAGPVPSDSGGVTHCVSPRWASPLPGIRQGESLLSTKRGGCPRIEEKGDISFSTGGLFPLSLFNLHEYFTTVEYSYIPRRLGDHNR